MYQNQLPFSPQQLMVPPGQYRSVPQFQFDQFVQPVSNAYITLCDMLINTIQQTAQQSPLRTFMFNQMAQNGFQNNDFASLAKSSLDYLAFAAMNSRNANPQQIMQQTVSDMLNFMSAVNVRQFPALANYCNTNQVQQVLQQFDNVSRQIAAAKSNMGSFGGNFGGGFNQPSQSFQSFPDNNGYGGNRPYSRFNDTHQQRGHHGSESSGLFSRDTGGHGQSETNGSSAMERNFARNARPSAPAQLVQSVEEVAPTQVTIDEANKGWKPTLDAPYRPAFQPSKQYLHVQKNGNNFAYQVREKGENGMDQAQHSLAPVFGNVSHMVSDRLPTASAIRIIEDAVGDAVAALQKNDNDDVVLDSYARLNLDNGNVALEIGRETCWALGQVQAVKKVRNDKLEVIPQIIQWSSRILTPFIMNSAADLKKLHNRLADAHHGNEVIAVLEEMKDVIPVDVLNLFDNRLADTVNRVLKVNMSIPGVSIDSFIDDWNVLVNHLSDAYGSGVAAILLNQEQRIIRMAISLLSPELETIANREIYDIEDSEYPIGYFCENNSFTLLRVFSSELDLSFVTSTSALLSKLDTRVYHMLAKQIFDQYGKTADQHFIRTTDGKVFEISKGWMCEDAYLISLAK